MKKYLMHVILSSAIFLLSQVVMAETNDNIDNESPASAIEFNANGECFDKPEYCTLCSSNPELCQGRIPAVTTPSAAIPPPVPNVDGDGTPGGGGGIGVGI